MKRCKQKKRLLIISVKLAQHVTLAMARKELRSRVNDGCGYYDCNIQSDIRIGKITQVTA